MLLIPAIILLAILCLLFIDAYTWTGFHTRKMISRLPGYTELQSWPLSLQGAFIPMEDVKDFLSKVFGKFPSLCSIWFLGRPNVCLISPDNIEDLLKNVQHVKKGNEYFILTEWLGEGLLTSSGAKWHANRKLLTPAFHFRILESCLPIFNKNTSLMINLLNEHITKNENTMIIEKFLSLCSLDIISEAAMGVSLQAQLHKKSSLEYVKAVRRMGELCLQRVKTFYLEKDWIYNLTPNGKEQKQLLNSLHTFTESVIKESKKKREAEKINQETDGRPTAFVDFLLEMAENEPGIFTDVEIRQEVDTFMFEGHETTTSSLSWSLLLLGHDQRVQDLVYNELVEILGKGDAQITKQDLTKMTYLEAVIKESLRLYPPVSYFSRKLETDLCLQKYKVPASTNAIIIPYFLHRQSELYPDPEQFLPERFLNMDTLNRHPFMYIPFSGGPRNCIGQRFAMMEMKVVLANILKNFKIQSITQRENLKIVFSPILRPVNGTCLQLWPRQK